MKYTPPEELLGNRENPYAKPEELSKWVIENAKKADAAVISSDSMVYGSLVASRKHNLSEDVVLSRVHNFEKNTSSKSKYEIICIWLNYENTSNK